MIEAGRIDKKITIQRATRAKDAHGQAVETFEDHRRVWANIRPVTAREFINGQQVTRDVTHIIRTRMVDVTADDRIVYGSRVFNIEAPPINVGESDEMLEIMAKEVVGGG